jgi:hypothetical protein
MYVNKEQVEMGIARYIETEIGNKATGFNKFATYFAMPIITKKASQVIDSFSTNEITKELFDDNKNLNIDEVYNMSKRAIQKSGQFVWMGMIFNETDIDKLYNCIRG